MAGEWFGAATSLLGKLIDIPTAFGLQSKNNIAAEDREEAARKENFQYNELAASNADARTRALYNDLYSPQAQLEQIKAAGLSPSLFYGDGGGISGQTGAQGAGAAGISPTTFGIQNGFDFASLGKIMAETDLIKAQTDNVKSNTQQTELENDLKEMENTEFKLEYELITSPVYDQNGNETSLYETAKNCDSYEEFIKTARESAKNSGREDILQYTSTEQGQKTLRNIYESQYKFDRNIAVLSSEKVDAEFIESVTKALSRTNYANKNAESVLQQLQAEIETNSLNSRQKEAFNNLIKKLDNKDSTTADIIITLLLIVNNALSNYHLPSRQTTIKNMKQNVE